MKYFLILISLFFIQSTSAQEEYKTVFNDDFNSNKNNWSTSNTELRYSQISGGKLIDYFGEKGFVTTNLTSSFFDKSSDYVIRFSLANLNNKKDLKYRTYTKKSNGKLKERWEANPIWGFVWGFKDWNNYNAFILQKSTDTYGFTKFNYKAFSKVNGSEISSDDWTKDYDYKFLGETDYYEFIIEKCSFGFMIYIDKPWYINGKKIDDKTLLCSLKGASQWYGNYFGPYIGAGAKISLDYIKIELPTPCKGAKSLISQGDKYLDQGSYSNAVTQYSKALKAGCVSHSLYFKRAKANANREFYASAIDDCSQALFLEGNKEETYYLRGVCKLKLNDDTGINDLEKGGDEGRMLLKELESLEDGTGSDKTISSGSGLKKKKNGYIVTNEHVIRNGTNITVSLFRNGIKSTYKAEIIKSDGVNDLAILKITDSNFKNFRSIAYGVRTYGVQVGESVFVMGYPMIDLQGEAIKITDGIISSKTGFQDDVTTYQISAPIQHGNSGGPLFDKKGNFIGITNAGIPDAENVGYAIKAVYLMNFLEVIDDIDLFFNNSISTKSFPNMIELLSDYIVLIKVNNKSNPNSINTKKQSNSQEFFDQGVIKYQNDDEEGAYTAFSHAINSDPNFAEAYFYRGYILLYKMNYKMAKEDFNNCIRLEPEFFEAYFYRGICNLELNNNNHAISDFTVCIERNNNYYDALELRASSKSELNDFQGAVDDYSIIIQLMKMENTPYLASIYNNKAYALLSLNKYSEALVLVNKALDIEKSESYIWDTRGETYYFLGKYSKCIEDMNKAISLEEHDNSYYVRGLAKIKLGDREDGCRDLHKAIEFGKVISSELLLTNCK